MYCRKKVNFIASFGLAQFDTWHTWYRWPNDWLNSGCGMKQFF